MNVFEIIAVREKEEVYQTYKQLKYICIETDRTRELQIMKQLISKHGSDYVARHLIMFSMKYNNGVYIDKLSSVFSRSMDIIGLVDIISPSAREIYEGSSSI